MDVDKAYDVRSKVYDSHRNKSNYFKIIEGITKKAVLENIDNKKIKKTCDIGCGTGRNIPLLLSLDAEVYALDYSKGMLEKAKAKYGSNKKVHFYHGSAVELPFKSGSFDVVGSFKALPHVPDLEKSIREMKRVAKKGAVVFIELYSPFSFRKLLNRFKHYTRWDSQKKAKRLISKVGGLKVKKIYGSRTFMITEFIANLPLLGKLFYYLENIFSNTWLNKFSGYYIIVCEKR